MLALNEHRNVSFEGA